MVTNPSQFRRSMDKVRSGSDQAVWELIEQYGPHIQRVVRRRLDRRLRSKFDSVDFVQMVWASFFRHPTRIARFDEPDELVKFLAVMARNKVADEYRRRLQYRKFNVGRERHLPDSETGESPTANDPTPSQIAVARECWSQMIRDEPERNCIIVRLRLQGMAYGEIARQVELDERTVRRIIQRLVSRPYDERIPVTKKPTVA